VDLTWNTEESAAERTAAAAENSGGGGTQRRPGESEPGGAKLGFASAANGYGRGLRGAGARGLSVHRAGLAMIGLGQKISTRRAV
jgi:hypothetical protein